MVDKDVFANGDMLPKVCVKRNEDRSTLVNRFVDDLAEARPHLLDRRRCIERGDNRCARKTTSHTAPISSLLRYHPANSF